MFLDTATDLPYLLYANISINDFVYYSIESSTLPERNAAFGTNGVIFRTSSETPYKYDRRCQEHCDKL